MHQDIMNAMHSEKSHISLLVVDDDEMASDMISRRFEREEYNVEIATDGASALDRMSVERFDLVLLDLMMPGMSGQEVLREMRRRPATYDTPVIMLTADSDKDSVLNCLDSGANDYLVKPVNFPLLKTRIWQQLNGRHLNNRGDPRELKFLAGKRVLVVDDDAMNCDVLVRRVERFGCVGESVNSGELALQRLEDTGYDIVLLDINMPGMDGIEVLRQIRRSERTTGLPVIMVSAQENPGVLSECVREGASDYISKPFNAVVLQTRMLACLHVLF